MTLRYTNPDHNRLMVEQYCKPHDIDPYKVLEIIDEVQAGYYVIEYLNKDDHFCTIKVFYKT